ncbi:MAG TPA: hypothetical protein VK694_06890 [Verrucomicrobiae bacterium]|nr:hypothetical protein [Verrucomicrobiae bacterium]
MFSMLTFRRMTLATLGLGALLFPICWFAAYGTQELSRAPHGDLFSAGVISGIIGVVIAYVLLMGTIHVEDADFGESQFLGHLMAAFGIVAAVLFVLGCIIAGFVSSSPEGGPIDTGVFGTIVISLLASYLTTFFVLVGAFGDETWIGGKKTDNNLFRDGVISGP